MPSLHSTILNWLSAGADVQVGIQLIKQYLPESIALGWISKNPPKHKALIIDVLAHIGQIPIDNPVRHNDGSTVFVAKNKSTFREEWPFLQDADCPNELKILVGDKITAYYNYINAYAKIADATTAHDQSNIASYLIDNYMENQQITAELKHYKETKTLLGQHPVFQQVARYQQWRKLAPIQLANMLTKTAYNIKRLERQLKSKDRPDLLSSREKKLNSYRKDQAELKRILS